MSELDLHARGDWLFYRPQALEFIEQMRADPDYYDAKSAGWWLWGICQWIGSGWERNEKRETTNRQRPHLGDAGMGINRKRPHLFRGRGLNRKRPHLFRGRGINRQRPHLGDAGMGINRKNGHASRGEYLIEYMGALSARLRDVRICCGDWRRVLGPSPTYKLGVTGIFLDPPYAPEGRDDVYGSHETENVFADVRDWAIEHGDNRLLRIALCGYDFEMPDGWTMMRWKPGGGYAGEGNGNGRANRKKERVWFNKFCLINQQEFEFSKPL